MQRALAEFSRSIQVESNVEANYEHGQTYESVGDHQKAIADFDEAIALRAMRRTSIAPAHRRS